MYEAMECKAYTEAKVIDGDEWHRVVVTEGISNPVWFSDRLYKQYTDAIGLASQINLVLFGLKCPNCGDPAQWIDHFGNVDSDPTDIVAKPCTEACRRQMNEEEGSLERAGL